mmetsp:Transcript_41992/g.101185  ORF Transcript_41992/g.101185 Transcript_41992/m.101185 type:complete len:480 (+) Transcript_41992:1052-2491(+)
MDEFMANIAATIQQMQQQNATLAAQNTVLQQQNTTVIAALQAAQPAAHQPVLDLFDSTSPFDLSTRNGANAMEKASAALGTSWDGTLELFNAFLLDLKARAREMHWDAAPNDGGILTIDGHDLLSEYHLIPMSDIEAARTNRTNDRAKQNSKSLFLTLSKSVRGELKIILFGLDGNLPAHADGPTLFKAMIATTAASSLQVSIRARDDLRDLDPADFDFKITAINAHASHLFSLATTSASTISDAERTQLLLSIYKRIKQPEEFFQWVGRKIDEFEDNTLTTPAGLKVHQGLMNSAALKATRLAVDTCTWKTTTVKEDIVAMNAAAQATKSAPKKPPRKTPEKEKETAPSGKSLPPFLRFYKRPDSEGNAPYVVGDVKEFQGQTWHFCDCPNHKGKVKWHTHPTKECRTRKKWLESDGAANAGIVDEDASDAPDTTGPIDTSALQAMLANAMTMVPQDEGNEGLQDCIGEMMLFVAQNS